MRRFKLQVQTTLDGYMAGPDGQMDWLTYPWTPDLDEYVDALMESVDTIVLGRKLAEGFIPAWKSRKSRPSGETGETDATIDWMNNTPKVVISNSLKESPWENAVLAGGDLEQTINDLKAQSGGDLIAYGGGTLVSSLIAKNLLDELHLFVNPASIGAGMPVFGNPGEYQKFQVVGAQLFECGILALRLEPRHV